MHSFPSKFSSNLELSFFTEHLVTVFVSIFVFIFPFPWAWNIYRRNALFYTLVICLSHITIKNKLQVVCTLFIAKSWSNTSCINKRFDFVFSRDHRRLTKDVGKANFSKLYIFESVNKWVGKRNYVLKKFFRKGHYFGQG